MASLNFDATNVQPYDDFTPVPAGDYMAMIIDSAMEATKTGRGSFLKLTLQIIDGPLSGRLLWDRLTLIHDNPKTVEIAQRQLSAICHAVGVMQVTDSAQLHQRPMIVRVKYVEADGQYAAKNEIGAYKPANGATTAPSTPRPTAPAAAPSQAAAQPWNRNPAEPAQALQQPTAPAPAQTPAPAPQATAPTGRKAPPWASKSAS